MANCTILRRLILAVTLILFADVPRVHAAGELDPLNLNLSLYNTFVMATAVQPDGKMIIGGRFSSVLGVPRSNIARINADGTLDMGFDPKAGGDVYCVAVQGDGKVLFGGYFTSPRQYLARVNTDGTLDWGFDPRPDNGVNGVAVQADGKVLLGGYFTTVQQASRSRIARVNADGTLDMGFYAAADSDVNGMAVQADGKVLLGGAFTQIQWPGDRTGFARLGNAAATQSLSTPDATQALWTRGGAGPEVGQVTFELSTDGGTNWTPLGAGTRIGTSANWRLNGLSLPASGSLRARGRTAGGNFNGASGLIQQVGAFSLSLGEPDIAVAQAGALTDGAGSVDFGVVNPGGSALAKTFTITNPGTATLSGLAVSVDGANAGDFTVSAPSSTSVAGGSGNATFTVTFTPGATGPRSAAIHITSNVTGAKNPFDIALTGRGNTPPALTMPVSPLIVQATSYSATVANFTVTASDAEDGVLAPIISRASGSTFSIGDTSRA